jgi:hypothetical protein
MRIIAGLAAALFLASAGAAMAQTGLDSGSTTHLTEPLQIPVGDASVSVPATTSTLVWTADAKARVLRVVPSNSTCNIQCDSAAAASANSTPIPSGYVWNQIEPPPANSCYMYCTTAATVAVSVGH